jgi:pimeloyl-ACP methyl ester carboxylesterase
MSASSTLPAMRSALAALTLLAAILWIPPLLAPRLGFTPDLAMLPRTGRSVPIENGHVLRVVEHGAGAPVVLVHGLPSNLEDWGDLPQRLAALGHHVVAYDRVGYGGSSRGKATGDAYTLASSARDLAALLDALALPQAAVVGWSYGGGVVQVLARDAPERVSQIVLLAAVGPAFGDVPHSALDTVLHSPAALPLLRWVAAIPPLSRAVMKSTLASLFSDPAAIPPGFVEHARAQLARPGTLEAFVAESVRMDTASLTPERIAAPTLVLSGSDDRSVPVAVAEDLARRIPGAELMLFEAGSHMLPITHSERLAETLHEWLEQTR